MNKTLRFSLLFSLLLMVGVAFAADTTYTVTGASLQSMLVSFAKSVPNLMRMVTAIAYVMGMYFIVAGVIKFKHYGESRTMMSQQHSIKGPLLFIIIGAILIYLPSAVQIGLGTLYGPPSPLSYPPSGGDFDQFLKVVYMVVQLVGVIAFIRGLVILSHLGEHGQPGTFGKGLSHIIGGLLCINIYLFVRIILNTLGISVTS